MGSASLGVLDQDDVPNLVRPNPSTVAKTLAWWMNQVIAVFLVVEQFIASGSGLPSAVFVRSLPCDYYRSSHSSALASSLAHCFVYVSVTDMPRAPGDCAPGSYFAAMTTSSLRTHARHRVSNTFPHIFLSITTPSQGCQKLRR